ncbi:pitrilysin family protein [soil metagenome]
MTATLHTLANGVRVIADPMPSLESAALTVVTGAGARYEDPGTNGWSHLREHRVFKGAGARSSRAIVEAIEQEGGWINAATGYERTSFQVRHLAGGLPLAMSVLADLLRRPTLDPAELEREKGVIAQEIAEAADTPDDQVFEMAQTAAFADQPLGRPILGSDATLAPVDVAALEGWRAALYGNPSRLVISAAGAVDEAALLKAAETAFGDLEAPAAALAPPSLGRFTGGDVAEARKLEQAHLVMLLPGVGVRDPRWAVQRLFAEVLGGGMASRLFQEARESRGLCYAVDAYAESYSDTGMLGVYAGTSAKDAKPMAQLAAAELLKLAQSVEPAELSRAKAQARSGLFMSREPPLSRAEQNAGQAILFDRLIEPSELAAAVDAVTAEDFATYGRSLVQAGAAATAVLGPKTAGSAGRVFSETLAKG